MIFTQNCIILPTTHHKRHKQQLSRHLNDGNIFMTILGKYETKIWTHNWGSWDLNKITMTMSQNIVRIVFVKN